MTKNTMESVLRRLQAALGEASPRQRAAAAFILENNKKAAFLNSTALAKAAGVSESTIIRLAAALGYSGFPEFQAALQAVIQHELTALERLPEAEEPGADTVLAAVFQAEAKSILRALGGVSMAEFTRAVDLLDASRRVYVAGAQASTAFAVYGAYSLGKVRPDVSLLSLDPPDIASVANGMGGQDAALVFGLPRYPTKTVRLLRLLHERKVPVILVTHSLSSPLCLDAAVAIAVPVRYHAFTDGLSPVFCLLNALILGVYQKNEERGREYLNHFESFVAGAEVFDTTLKYTF